MILDRFHEPSLQSSSLAALVGSFPAAHRLPLFNPTAAPMQGLDRRDLSPGAVLRAASLCFEEPKPLPTRCPSPTRLDRPLPFANTPPRPFASLPSPPASSAQPQPHTNGITPPKIRLPPPKARPVGSDAVHESPHEPTFGVEHASAKARACHNGMEQHSHNGESHLHPEVHERASCHGHVMAGTHEHAGHTQPIGQSTHDWPELGKAPHERHPRALAPVPVLQHVQQNSTAGQPSQHPHSALLAQHHAWPTQPDLVAHSSACPRTHRHIQPAVQAELRTRSPEVSNQANVGQGSGQKMQYSHVQPWHAHFPHKGHQVELNAGLVDPQLVSPQLVRVFPTPHPQRCQRHGSFNSVEELDFSGSDSPTGSDVLRRSTYGPKWRVEGKAGTSRHAPPPPMLPTQKMMHSGSPAQRGGSCATRSLDVAELATPTTLSHAADQDERRHLYSPSRRCLEAGRRVSKRHSQLQCSNHLSHQEAQMALVATELHRPGGVQDDFDRHNLPPTPEQPRGCPATSAISNHGLASPQDPARHDSAAGGQDLAHVAAKREVSIDGLVDAEHLTSRRTAPSIVSQPDFRRAGANYAVASRSAISFDKPRSSLAIDHGPPTPWEEEPTVPGTQEGSRASSHDGRPDHATSVASSKQSSGGSRHSNDASQYSYENSHSSEAVEGELVSSQHSRQSEGSVAKSIRSEAPDVTMTQRSVSVTSAAVNATARDLWQAEPGTGSEPTDVHAIFNLPNSPGSQRLSLSSPGMEVSAQLSEEPRASGSANSGQRSGANTPAGTVSFGGGEEVSVAARSRASRSSDGDLDHPSEEDDEYWEDEEEEEEWYEDEEEESEVVDGVED